jgi:CHAD domain-containing protein
MPKRSAHKKRSRSKPSCEYIVRSVIGREAAGILKFDPVARQGDDPEGVHQLRVCTRRLRAELKIFTPVLKKRPLRRLRRELSWLGGVLGRQRDLDVLYDLLQSLSDELPLSLDRSVMKKIDQRRQREKIRVRAALKSKRYRRLVSALCKAVMDPPLRKNASKRASAIFKPELARTLNTLFKSADKYGPTSSVLQLHRVRIMAKHGRYSSEVACAYLGKDATNVASALAEVQEILGHLHDQAEAVAYLSARRMRPGGNCAEGGSVESITAAIDWLGESIEKLKSMWRGPLADARSLVGELLD